MRVLLRTPSAVSGLLVAIPVLASCAATPAAPAEGPRAAQPAASAASVVPRSPLSSEEEAMQRRLATHLDQLSGRMGERHPGKPWELADAADYLAAELEGMGYALERQGYEAGDGGEVAAQNLIVTSKGGAGGEQVILVGAHYDSPPGEKGRNAGASGAAAVLELARAFAQGQHSRTIRFCLFALGEPPHGDGATRGARVYGEAVGKRRAAAEAELAKDAELKAKGSLPEALPAPAVDRSRIVAAILLDRLLSFPADPKGTELSVGLSYGPGSDAYVNALADELSTPPLLVERTRLETTELDSDARYWLTQNVPVVLVHGSGAPADDLDALTRVVFGLRAALNEAAGSQATTGNPFMQ